MYKIKENVTINDFDTKTKELFIKAGFEEDNNISEEFKEFLKKKGICFNENNEFDL